MLYDLTIPWLSAPQKRKFRLTNIEPFEVSLVDNGANRRTFLVVKREQNAMSTTTQGLDTAAPKLTPLLDGLAAFTDLVERAQKQANPDDAMIAEGIETVLKCLGISIEKAVEAPAAAVEVPTVVAPVDAAPAPATAVVPPAIEAASVDGAVGQALETKQDEQPAALPATGVDAPTSNTAPVAPATSETAATDVAAPIDVEAVSGLATLLKSLNLRLMDTAGRPVTLVAVQEDAIALTAPLAQAPADAALAEIRKQLTAQGQLLTETQALVAKMRSEPQAPASRPSDAEAAGSGRSLTTSGIMDYNDPAVRRRFSNAS